jgi:hypothetical protein
LLSFLFQLKHTIESTTTITTTRYVNASSFDQENDVYYGLLNNFNGPSLGQKLITVNVSSGESEIYDYDPTAAGSGGGLLYYIAYTEQGLYGMAAKDVTGYANLGKLDYSPDKSGSGVVFKQVTMFMDGENPLAKYSPLYRNSNTQVCIVLGSGDQTQSDISCLDDTSSYWRANFLQAGSGYAAAVAAFPSSS